MEFLLESFLEMRFERKKKNCVCSCLGFTQFRVEQRLVPPFFSRKKNSKILELVFSPLVTFSLSFFVCVCVCVCVVVDWVVEFKRRTKKMKYVVVSGGVVSGLGKGVTASSVGVMLSAADYRVTHIKIDPYINVDAGTMSPFEHGETYVLDDGGESDLDLGNYERFCDINLTRDHNITTGKVYQSVIEREREGKYLGKTVQVISTRDG